MIRLLLLKFEIDAIIYTRKLLFVLAKFLRTKSEALKDYYNGENNIQNVNNTTSDRVVYTVLTGDYDNLINLYSYDKNWHYICFTDNKTLIENGHPFWKIIPLDIKNEDAAKMSRMPKILAHKFLPDYRYSLYIDANVNILSGKVYKRIEQLIKNGAKFAVTKHFLRKFVIEEIIACVASQKETPENAIKLLAKYNEEKFPDNLGLLENNVIFRQHNDVEVIQIMEDWWYMVDNYSKRDQLSLMYVFWNSKFKCEPLFCKPLRYCPFDFLFRPHKGETQ